MAALRQLPLAAFSWREQGYAHGQASTAFCIRIVGFCLYD